MFFGHENDPYFDVSCYPLGTLDSLDLVRTSDKWAMYYYSPAICPYNWIVATTFQSDVPGGSVIPLDTQTTAALCCPSGFHYLGAGHRCVSTVSRDQRIPYVSPTSNGADGWIRGLVSTSTLDSEMTVYGDGVPIWWQSSDEAVLAKAAAATNSIATASEVQSSAQSVTPSASGSSMTELEPAKKDGLSSGAKAGIGVSVAVCILGAILAAFLVFLRRRHQSTRSKQSAQSAQFLPAFGGMAPVEKPADAAPLEMPVHAEPAELHAHTRRATDMDSGPLP
ncbi:hypothetical protein DPSP01_014541 [Paraphaeosphaeria sporulosa]